MSSGQQPAPSWIQRYVDAWNSRDGASVIAHLADDVVYTDLALGERFEGRDAVRQFVDRISVEFSTDYRFSLGQVVSTEDTYAFEWTLSGTNDRAGAERGLPATGQPFEIPGVAVGRLREGKIVENRSYWNFAGYLMQVGLMPQPEQAGAGRS